MTKLTQEGNKMSHNACKIPQDHTRPQLITRVAIFGFANAPLEADLYKDAHEVAKELAECGYTIINGGGPGVMRAATDGAKEGGGKVIGVTFKPEGMATFEGRDSDNQVDKEITTSNYLERTLKLLQLGQVYVVFNGGTGTISEFGMAWGLARLYFGHHKPLILYGHFWNEVIETFKKYMYLRPADLEVFKIANSPHEVLTEITTFGEEIAAGKHAHLAITNNGESAFTL